MFGTLRLVGTYGNQLAELKAGEKMRVKGLQKMAKQLGIKTNGLRKDEMIGMIHSAEGNVDCFGTAVDYCDQMNCPFRKDYLN